MIKKKKKKVLGKCVTSQSWEDEDLTDWRWASNPSASCSSRHSPSHVSLFPYAAQCSPGRWAELRMTSWLSDLQLARDWWGLPLGLDLRIPNPLLAHLLLGLLPDNLLLPSPCLSSQIPQPGVLYTSWSSGNSFTTSVKNSVPFERLIDLLSDGSFSPY